MTGSRNIANLGQEVGQETTVVPHARPFAARVYSSTKAVRPVAVGRRTCRWTVVGGLPTSFQRSASPDEDNRRLAVVHWRRLSTYQVPEPPAPASRRRAPMRNRFLLSDAGPAHADTHNTTVNNEMSFLSSPCPRSQNFPTPLNDSLFVNFLTLKIEPPLLPGIAKGGSQKLTKFKFARCTNERRRNRFERRRWRDAHT